MLRNLQKIAVMAFFCLPVVGQAKWMDKSELETVDMVRCTAAVMRAGMGIELYRKWTKALEQRYSKMYKSKTAKEVDAYISERILDKRAELQRQGMQTTAALKRYYDLNCKNFHP